MLFPADKSRMFWMWCSTQNQSASPFVGFLRHSIASFILCIWPEKKKKIWHLANNHDINLEKQTPTIYRSGDRITVKKKQKKPKVFLSGIKEITKLLLLRCTWFGDVEVLSDLFLRERLERLHVPHRLDVVPPEVGFVLRQSQRL